MRMNSKNDTTNSLISIGSEVFYTIDIFSKSNEIYGSNHSISCSPDISVSENEIIIDYSYCKDVKSLNYLDNIFKKYQRDSIFTISDGIYRDTTLGIEDINFSGEFIFYEYDNKKKIIRGRSSVSFSSYPIKIFKKENFIYVPQIKISNNENQETEFGLINYSLNEQSSFTKTFDIRTGDYLKFIGTNNNDNKLFAVHSVEERSDGSEIIYFRNETTTENLFNSPVLVQIFTEKSSENQRLDGQDGDPPVLPWPGADYPNGGCLDQYFSDVKCDCACQHNCLMPALQYIESRSAGGRDVCNGSGCCYQDGCGARQRGKDGEWPNGFGQGRRGYGPYQINEEFVKDCAGVWCEEKPQNNPSPSKYVRRQPRGIAEFCKATVCEDIYTSPVEGVSGPAPDNGQETWPLLWRGPTGASAAGASGASGPFGGYDDYDTQCYLAKVKSERAMTCCWSRWMTNSRTACSPDKMFCMNIARLHHCPTCECSDPPGNFCGVDTKTCNFSLGSPDNCSGSASYNLGSLSRCDCYQKKMEYTLCFLKKYGFIPAWCTYGERPDPLNIPGGVTCSSDTWAGAGCFALHCTNSTPFKIPTIPGCEVQGTGREQQIIETDKGTFIGTQTPDFVTQFTKVEEPQQVIQNNGPYAIDGYYPLYLTPEAAKEASPAPNKKRPGERTVGYHDVEVRNITYYRPNGLVQRKTQFDGDYPYQWL
jgi:hypothetical protein